MNKTDIRKIVLETVEDHDKGRIHALQGRLGQPPEEADLCLRPGQGGMTKMDLEQIKKIVLEVIEAWNGDDHPRGDDGKFTSGPSQGERIAKMKKEKRAARDEVIRSKVRAQAKEKQKKDWDEQTKKLRLKKEWRTAAKKRSEEQQKKARDDEWKRQRPSAADKGV